MSEKPMSNEFHGDNWHPNEVLSDEIEHDEKKHEDLEGKEDSRVVLLRDRALKSLQPEFSRIYNSQGGYESTNMEYDPCDQFLKEVGGRRVEEILGNSKLSLEIKGKILADLNHNLNEGIGFGKAGRDPLDHKRKFKISDGIEVKGGEVKMKEPFIKEKNYEVFIVKKERAVEVLEGLLMGNLVYRHSNGVESAINNVEALAKLTEKSFDDTLTKYLKYFEERPKSKGGSSRPEYDRVLAKYGYVWDAESQHYVSLKEKNHN